MSSAVRFAPYIDHTLLAPDATASDIDLVCEQAARHGVAAVCVNPVWVGRCSDRLQGTSVMVAAVVGFPFGASESAIKAAEAALAVERGAQELDMVAALGFLRAGRWRYAERDIAAVIRETEGARVKVIVESAMLSPEELVRACEIVRDAGAACVKTSTGFHPSGGATIAAVRLMRQTVHDAIGVKASGGIHDSAAATAMFAAGATRLGTSRGAELAEYVGIGPVSWRDLIAGAPTTRALEERTQ